MKILELRSENFKRLKALEIRPDGSLVTIAGRNGAGKTSVLDSIYAALAGKAAAPAVPIRKGAEQERNEQKAAAIEAANLPVPGLAFGDGAVTLNGVPFEQASDAEKLRASVAIAATLAGKLKVIRIRDGSLLDDDGMRILADFGEQHGMQIWLEKVDSSGRVGFVIENGELVAPTEEAAA